VEECDQVPQVRAEAIQALTDQNIELATSRVDQ
jgi:hypothetical protein